MHNTEAKYIRLKTKLKELRTQINAIDNNILWRAEHGTEWGILLPEHNNMLIMETHEQRIYKRMKQLERANHHHHF
jgi:hypothetical protein